MNFLYSFATVVRSNPGFMRVLYTMNKCEWVLIKPNTRLRLLQMVVTFRGGSRTAATSKIERFVIKAVNYFRKTLNLRYLTGF